MIYYYGGDYGPITKVDIGVFIGMNILWVIGWIISVVKWYIKCRRTDWFYKFNLFECRWDDMSGMFCLIIDVVMGILWIAVILWLFGKIISMFL